MTLGPNNLKMPLASIEDDQINPMNTERGGGFLLASNTTLFNSITAGDQTVDNTTTSRNQLRTMRGIPEAFSESLTHVPIVNLAPNAQATLGSRTLRLKSATANMRAPATKKAANQVN